MKSVLFFILIFLLHSCIVLAPLQKTNGPTNGVLFTQNKFPGDFNPNNDVLPVKKAEGCIHQILYIAMWGDAGAGSIAMKNKIKKIAYIDHSVINALGLYNNFCTIVSGE